MSMEMSDDFNAPLTLNIDVQSSSDLPKQ